MQTIHALGESLSSYLSEEQTNQVKRAYFYAEQAHYGQKRQSGEPYVTHPLAVAGILSEMHMDHSSLMAAMLHDVIEDTAVSKLDIENQFGETVAELVDGVSKLTQLEFGSKAEQQAENFQKMALATAKDIRVILVKLADRLHNMRTLGVLRSDKKRRIAAETLEMYAPIALRLGMHNTRVELENLGFSAMHPMRAERISEALKQARGNRSELVKTIKHQIEARLKKEGHKTEVLGREKHLYSIYNKMRTRKRFKEIMDIFAFRIIVDSVDTCYRVLGCVHSLYKPVPGEFKDYIAMPKVNGYQSLHTVLKGMHGVPIEIQIRTKEMDDMAQNGIAAHWLYKSVEIPNTNVGQSRARQWVQGLLEMQQRAGDSLEFIENVKIDLFPDEIYVFTPKGKILELPRGATAIDFAYAVHTDVGNSCMTCRINHRMAPLSEPLQSGQTVEIVTAVRATPNPAWLNYAVTAKARTNIRHFLKNQQQEESVELGQRLLEKALRDLNSSIEELPKKRLKEFLKNTDYSQFDDMLKDLALGNRVAAITAKQLLDIEENDTSLKPGSHPVAIRGTEGIMVSYANCCHPIPGDAIAGYISSGRGLVIHTESCHNLEDIRSQSDKMINLHWADNIDRTFSAELRVEVENQLGMIATLATRINSLNVNIEKISTEDKDHLFCYVNLQISVASRVHLARIMKRIRTTSGVRKVIRMRN